MIFKVQLRWNWQWFQICNFLIPDHYRNLKNILSHCHRIINLLIKMEYMFIRIIHNLRLLCLLLNLCLLLYWHRLRIEQIFNSIVKPLLRQLLQEWNKQTLRMQRHLVIKKKCLREVRQNLRLKLDRMI